MREERSLTGFDAEIGWRVPVFAAGGDTNLRIFGGGYRFYADDVNPVQGPRARVELAFDEVPLLWSGSRLALGGEVQHDGPRGTTGFASLRLRIPLQASAAGAARLTPLERRMADPVVRDIDIVAQSRSSATPSTSETATAVSGGNALVVIDSGTANIATAVTNAGANATILFSGTLTTTASIVPVAGQTLRGGGSLTVQGASGRTATLTLGSTATVNRTNGSNTFAVTNANVTITNLTIDNTLAGAARAVTSSASNLTVSNSTLTANSTGADTTVLELTGGNATLSSNTITASGSGGNNAWAVSVQNATATISSNSVGASGGAINRYLSLNTATINAGSTSNTQTGGVCSAAGGSGSSITFTNAANCGP